MTTTTSTYIKLPEIIVIWKVNISVPDLRSNWDIDFKDLEDYSRFLKAISDTLSRLNLNEAVEHDDGWEILTTEKDLIKEGCIDNHGEEPDISAFAENLEYLDLDEKTASEIFNNLDKYAEKYTVHKDGYYKLIKEDNDRKQLELNFEKGFNNELKVDPKGLERSIGSKD